MFEMHARWLEELKSHVNTAGEITHTTGYMTSVAISSEICDVCADPGKHDYWTWRSLATDLDDALKYLGPKMACVLTTPITAILDAIRNELFIPRNGKNPMVDDTKRALVTRYAIALHDLLDEDIVILSSWRDLVEACKNDDHLVYPYDRIAFLRDNLFALIRHRRQDDGPWGTSQTAVGILLDYGHQVSRAQQALGDKAFEFDPRHQSRPTGLDAPGRMDLSERWIVRRARRTESVVWFRIADAYTRALSCLTHDNITFYPAQVLAGGIIDHDVARELFPVVPEELLTDRISSFQQSGEIDEYTGIEHKPGLVYARVVIPSAEPHLAGAKARAHLDALLTLTRPSKDTWTVLNGELLFAQGRMPRLDWGPKHRRKTTIFPENDRTAANLDALSNSGYIITSEVAGHLRPVQLLIDQIESANDSESIVMAAVRAIEHLNTWSTRATEKWYKFVKTYLAEEYTRFAFLERATQTTFEAIVRTLPDTSPTASPQPVLDTIRDEVEGGTWRTSFDRLKALGYIADLNTIYTKHPLIRRLREVEHILSSGRSIQDAFDEEERRVDARVARLTRTRNAAIHGGPLSPAACDSVVDFARALSLQALSHAVTSALSGTDVQTVMDQRRLAEVQRADDLRQKAEVKDLFNS